MTNTTPAKRAKAKATEAEKDKKEDDNVKQITVHHPRMDFNDAILVCKNDSGFFVHFHVESAVLACVSSLFLNLLTDCKNDDEEGGKSKIPLHEDAATVETFLNVIYGKDEITASDSFHHLFMVLQMGDKFCTTFVVDRMVFQLCDLLREYVEVSKPITSRYGNAVILKLLSLCRRIELKHIMASILAFDTLKSTILRHWHQYLRKCGAKFLGKCACSCGNCECTSRYCSQNTAFDTAFSRLSIDMFFPDESSAGYFTALDVLLFSNALNAYLHNGGDAERALVEFFSPPPQKEKEPSPPSLAPTTT